MCSSFSIHNTLVLSVFIVSVFVCLFICLLEQHWLSSSTQYPSAMERIQNLEASKCLPTNEEVTDTNFDPPIFVEHINNVSCAGGETANFQCKVEPKNDPSLEISKLVHLKFEYEP